MPTQEPCAQCHRNGTVALTPTGLRGPGRDKGARLTGLVDAAEAGEGGIQAGTLLAVGPKLLQGGTDLLVGHVQQLLQAQLPGGDFLMGRGGGRREGREWGRSEEGTIQEHPLNQYIQARRGEAVPSHCPIWVTDPNPLIFHLNPPENPEGRAQASGLSRVFAQSEAYPDPAQHWDTWGHHKNLP